MPATVTPRARAHRKHRPLQFDTLETRTLLSVAFSTTAFSAGSSPRSILARDFTGDGKIDLVIANQAGSTISLLKGNGDGTFAAAQDITVGQLPNALTAGDFNGDGSLDLAVANYTSQTISVLLNTGNGSFAPKLDLGFAPKPTSLVAADIDADSKTDLIMVSDNSGPIIFWGNGDGTFKTPITYGGSAGATQVLVADMNHDGNNELIISHGTAVNSSSPGVDVSISAGFQASTGHVNWYSPTKYSVSPGYPVGIVVADFTRDGIPDVAAASGAGLNQMLLLANNGNGILAAPVQYASGTGPQAIAAADFNGDGAMDVAIPNQTSQSASIFLNLGAGTFGPRIDFPIDADPRGIVAADFNGDGKPDLAVTHFSSNKITILLNQPRQAAPTSTTIASSSLTSAYGQAVSFQAHVASSAGIPAGTVTFTDAGQFLGAATLDSNGNAAFTTSSLAIGFHSIAADYAGDTNFAGSSWKLGQTVTKADPIITWPTPAPIPLGTLISSTQLNATANVPGTFSYSPQIGMLITAGNRTLSATFVPTDTTHYNIKNVSVPLTVMQMAPTVTLTSNLNPATSGRTLVFTAGVGGSLVGATGAIQFQIDGVNFGTPVPINGGASSGYIASLSVGNHTITALYPGDSNYFPASKSFTQTITPLNLITPTITWNDPAPITVGTPLSAAQLNATSSAVGRFVYSPAAGTILPPGTQTLLATFYPNDDSTYTTATKAVTISVGNVATPPNLYLPNGFLDLANPAKVAGWALDKDALITSLTIRIDIDGTTAGTTTASLARPDLLKPYKSASHGFSYNLPTLSAGLHRIDVYALDPATSTPKLIGSREIDTNKLPTGWIDVATPAILKGWAFDTNLGGSPLDILYRIDANAPQKDRADIVRNDLNAVLGTPNHGFSINLPALTSGRHTVTLWAVDPDTQKLASLGSRTITAISPVGNPLPKGGINWITATNVTGWAYDPSLPKNAINIRVDVDGVPGTPAMANVLRKDLLRPIGSIFHGFSRPLTLSPGAHTIAVYAIDTTTNTAVLLKSQIVGNPAPRGFLDAITPTSALGWAFLPALNGNPATVRLDIDNLPAITATAGNSRPDLTPSLGSPNFGFTITLPKLLPGKHTAKVYLIDPLTLAPTLIGSKNFII